MEPAFTVTVAGAAKKGWLEAIVTVNPPVGAALVRVTVPFADAPPLIRFGETETEETACPNPLATKTPTKMQSIHARSAETLLEKLNVIDPSEPVQPVQTGIYKLNADKTNKAKQTMELFGFW